MSCALITGGGGQDGHYLAELLRARGVSVRAPARAELDVTRAGDVEAAIAALRPTQIYHLAAHHRSSEAGAADDDDARFLAVSLGGGEAVLRAVRRHAPRCRVFLASSAHVFGDASVCPQDEATPLAPRHPYAIAKAALLHLGRWYREAHGLFVVGGILFNHESPRRGPSFVTQRIARAAACGERVVLGDLDAQVDWGYAPEYVDAMHRTLESAQADDYVIATGRAHTVRELAELAFAHAGRDWAAFVDHDPRVFQPVARRPYVGRPARIEARCGWRATTSLAQIAAVMVDAAREVAR